MEYVYGKHEDRAVVHYYKGTNWSVYPAHEIACSMFELIEYDTFPFKPPSTPTRAENYPRSSMTCSMTRSILASYIDFANAP